MHPGSHLRMSRTGTQDEDRVNSMTADLETGLLATMRRVAPEAAGIANLRRLSGGASRESWSFDLETPKGTEPLILRRAPAGLDAAAPEASLPPDTEARLQAAAFEAGVPVPGVRLVLEPADGLGLGYVMARVAGETIARRILRDARYATARANLPRGCGAALARVHGMNAKSFEGALSEMPAEAELARYRRIHDGFGEPHPVLEVGFKWLAERLPEPGPPAIVHGDFRNGNFIVGEEGLRAVLDWELAHLGDPAEDLAWLCVPSWRYGELDRPAGGFGAREDLFAAYEAAGGGPVDPARVHFWEVLGTLKWGIMCQMLSHAHLDGHIRSVERAAIGRRVSEAEIDLLAYLDGAMP